MDTIRGDATVQVPGPERALTVSIASVLPASLNTTSTDLEGVFETAGLGGITTSMACWSEYSAHQQQAIPPYRGPASPYDTVRVLEAANIGLPFASLVGAPARSCTVMVVLT